MSTGSLQEREQSLAAEKQRLYDELRQYPTPIAGCDQQFNYLLEQQVRVTAELQHVREQINTAASTGESPG